MGNCISQPTSTRSDRQVQRKPSRQVDPISISRVNKGDDSTHHSDALPTSGSAHLLELPEDNVTNLCHSNVDNEGYKAMLACHDKLVTALATDYLSIAGVLLAHGFVSEEVFAKMLLPSLTPTEKATVVVTAVRERIKNAPQNFPEVVKIFSEHTSTTCVVNLLQSSYRGDKLTEMPDHFRHYLKTLYASLTPTQASADTWPPSATRKVFNLAMIMTTEIRRGRIQDEFVRQTITGKVDDILKEKHPVNLEDIFNGTDDPQDKRKVVLLEGAPGCGKSTLAVHISQQWGEGKLFMEFDYAILVRLRDPAIQAASCIADLLPAKDDEMRQQAASKICGNDGHKFMFILDGWDELPTNLQKNSIFYAMIQPQLSPANSLLKCTTIVTSRPIASGNLHPLTSSRVEILGFTPTELRDYFTECLKGDGKAVETLFERIHENPAIAGSCYLPMNASILVHLFINDNNTLPTTQYGVFSEVVLSCIYRHLNERTQFRNLTLESLQEVPEAIKEPFLFLCELAYQGVMDDRVVFSSLPSDVNTLGLLQGVESFVRRGKAVTYNFLHLSIQEILAGFYIATQLPDDEQVLKFNELFDKSRFSAVFQFYAAITKLQTPGIKDVVIRVAKTAQNTLLLSLLHCLYEAQDPSLCDSVAQQRQQILDLSNTTLTPSDCLCIGYFLSHICNMATGEFRVSLSACSISDQGYKYLASGLRKGLDTRNTVTTPLTLNLNCNRITSDGFHHLSSLLEVDCIEDLILGGGYYFLHNSSNCTGSIKGTFTKQLKNSTMLKSLNLKGCGLALRSAKSLAEALTVNSHLRELDIGDNEFVRDDGIQYLAQALSVNQGLKNT